MLDYWITGFVGEMRGKQRDPPHRHRRPRSVGIRHGDENAAVPGYEEAQAQLGSVVHE